MVKFFRKREVLSPELQDNDCYNKWSKVVDKATSDYNSLTKEERIWYNIRVLLDSVNGGGLISYYYNSGASHVYETIQDLKSLEMNEISKFIEIYNEILFGTETVPTDIDIRNDIIVNITSSKNDSLNDLELHIMNEVDSLEDKLNEYLINQSLIK